MLQTQQIFIQVQVSVHKKFAKAQFEFLFQIFKFELGKKDKSYWVWLLSSG